MFFVDTSAFFTILDVAEHQHHRARGLWNQLVSDHELLVTSNYIVTETTALAQNRLGISAIRSLYQDILPIIQVTWVDEDIHSAAIAALFTANRRSLSLVDCSSFEVMRRRGITRVFAFDEHFREQGFEVLP
jgi:uncharacterized protein